MKTSAIKVRGMLSVMSVLGVEKRIGDVPGVESITVNYAAGSATVRYDETRLGSPISSQSCAKEGMRQWANPYPGMKANTSPRRYLEVTGIAIGRAQAQHTSRRNARSAESAPNFRHLQIVLQSRTVCAPAHIPRPARRKQ